MVSLGRPTNRSLALSERELQILRCVANGLSSREAADRLGIRPRTIERYIEQLRYKLQARNKSHLVAKAMATGQLEEGTSTGK